MFETKLEVNINLAVIVKLNVLVNLKLIVIMERLL